MKHVGSSNYIIYFDSYRVDHICLDFSTNLGLSAVEAQASITFLNADSLENWKAYLTEVRIFVKDIYTGKFRQVFEGDITGRNGSASRQSTGRTVYTVKGLYTWLELPVPMYIKNIDNLDVLRRFQLQAQNIDVDAVTKLLQNRKELFGTDKTLEQLIHKLFDLLDQGYSKITDNDTAFGFKDMRTKFKVMSDIDPKFRDKGFLDLIAFTQATTLQGFYDFLNEVLSQMMMEFYQDIDGSMKVKGPSWNDDIPKSHIIDESVTDEITRGITWDAQPTRILVIGGKSEILEAMYSGTDGGNAVNMQIPVGLYINGYKYVGMNFDAFLADGGGGSGGVDGNEDYVEGWFDDITSKKQYANCSYLDPMYEKLKINGGRPHFGVDYYMHFETLRNQGTDGVVEENRVITGGGNTLTIKQMINGTPYYFTYMHLKELPNLKKGDKVKAGQKIATTGGSGIGPPHLHFQVWKGGIDWTLNGQRTLTIDPVPFMKKMKEAAKNYGGDTPGNLYSSRDYKGPATTTNGYVAGVPAKIDGMNKYDSIIESVCKREGVNPMLVKIIGAIESGGDAKAIGDMTKYGRARGLLQIIPSIVGIKVDADKLFDPEYNITMFCKAMKSEKMPMMKNRGLSTSVYYAAYFWYGYNANGKAYADSFAQMYEGFPGLHRDDSITGNFTVKKGTSKNNSNTGPKVSGPQGPSLMMAQSLIQGEQNPNFFPSAVLNPGDGPSTPPVNDNPYSPGGSFQEGTPDASPDKNKLVDGKGVDAPNKNHAQKFVLPSGKGDLAAIFKKNSNGVDVNLIWAIAKEFSNLDNRASKKDDQTTAPEFHYGLMGVPKSYMDKHNLSEAEMMDPAKNVHYATKFYQECFEATKKHSFALLVYFLGGGGLGVLDKLKEQAKDGGVKYSFVDMLHLIEGIYDPKRQGYYLFDYAAGAFKDDRPPIRRAIMNWTQGTLDNYASLFDGNYITGDPHRGFKDNPNYNAKPGTVILVLDAQQGGKNEGNKANGLVEKTLTLAFAKNVDGKLGKKIDKGDKDSEKKYETLDVKMTRTGDATITNKERAKAIEKYQAAQVYSFSFSEGGNGVTIYVRSGATVGSKTLQEKIASRVKPVTEKHNIRFNGMKTISGGLLDELKNESAIIVDLGHLDSEKDATLIKNTDYLEDMAVAIAGGIVSTANADGNQASNPSAPSTGTGFPDFFSKYKPDLSPEEKKYKMQFTMLEMELIRAGGETGGNLAAAEAYLEQFAKYMMHVLRARATGITVPCVHAMPHIRPGFNAWLEPTRKDKVFYVTGIQHAGNFMTGVTSTIRGAYTRNPEEYDEKFNDNLFVSKTNYRASDLVPVIKKSEMDDVRDALRAIHREKVVNGSNHDYLKSLYTVKENPNKSIIQGNWNALMTEGQIAKEIKERFKDAPRVVDARVRDGREALNKAEDLHSEYMKRRKTE